MKHINFKEAHRIILIVFFITLTLILCYELWWMKYPSATPVIFKIGLLLSRIGYSIIASSVFYFVSQYIPVYLPKQDKKIKILQRIYQNIQIIDTIIYNLKYHLNIRDQEYLDNALFSEKLRLVNMEVPIGSYPNWHLYLRDVKTDLHDIISTIVTYNEYVSVKMIEELSIIQHHLFSSLVFAGRKKLQCNDLTFGELALQEIFVHNTHLQALNEKEYLLYNRQFKKNATVYRKENYPKNLSEPSA